uniref:Uncharacterized protein n=1 Tax=Alexandrium monilatum TaxID=311494 RepID=A0A7S4SRK2_9DINO|mmetsp:Transcript_13355/g.42659  ORF Transcript_13355/g.42659 Transcript_13355/m.42659 type:complete len:441 (+) Transcript_13355:116-1438(+)
MASNAASVRIELLAGGDVAQAPAGSHVLLEASSGALMHALRLSEGLFALRGGCTRTLQVMRSLPSAAVVHYPPPLGPSCDAERAQAAERARGLAGLSSEQVLSHLERAGADSKELSAGGEALVSELLCSFCVTGAARSWGATAAYRAERGRGSEAIRTQHSAPASALAAPPPVLRVSPAALPGALEASSCRSSTTSTAASQGAGSAWESSSALSQPHSTIGLPSRSHGSSESAGVASTSRSLPLEEEKGSSFTSTLQEKALATALHLGLKGPAARAAGAVAAVSCEGYALYREILEHNDQFDHRNINEDQYKERVCESAVSSSGRAMGGLAGAAAGQAAIPVPIVGAVVGGVLGAACGGYHANSLVRGAWRLSGAKAKGGDDLVRCVEHKPDMAEAANSGGVTLGSSDTDLGCSLTACSAPSPASLPRQEEEEEEEAYLL